MEKKWLLRQIKVWYTVNNCNASTQKVGAQGSETQGLPGSQKQNTVTKRISFFKVLSLLAITIYTSTQQGPNTWLKLYVKEKYLLYTGISPGTKLSVLVIYILKETIKKV